MLHSIYIPIYYCILFVGIRGLVATFGEFPTDGDTVRSVVDIVPDRFQSVEQGFLIKLVGVA